VYGGGIYAGAGGAIVLSIISGNRAYANASMAAAVGGGVSSSFSSLETLYILASTISDNLIDASTGGYGGAIGGGIFARSLLVSDSVISGNTCLCYGPDNPARGGGISVFANSATIRNCTVSGNTAAGDVSQGGGVDLSHVDEAIITATTISGNHAGGQYYYGGSGGGLRVWWQSQASLVSNIVSGNTITSPGSGPDVFEGSGAIVTASYNLIGDPSGSSIPIGVDGNITGDPLLGPLQDNGGRTYTHALDPASPAVDAGANPAGLTSDQRRYGPRAVNARTDIGAYELDSLPVLFDDGFISGDTSAWSRSGP
jgi:hypothetical protein